MTLKNKPRAVVLMAVLTILCSVPGLASQEAQGEFVTVHSARLGGERFYNQQEAEKLHDEIRVQIKSAAIEACAGRDYNIDTPTFHYQVKQRFTDEPHYYVSGEARVFCLN